MSTRKSKQNRRVHLEDGSEWCYHIAGGHEGGTVTIMPPKNHDNYKFHPSDRWEVPFSVLDPDTQESLDQEEEQRQQDWENGIEWWGDTGYGGCPWSITPRAVKDYILTTILNRPQKQPE